MWISKSQITQLIQSFALIQQKLDKIISTQDKHGKLMAQIDDEITQLQADVTAAKGAQDSAIALINGIAGKIAAAVQAAQAAGATTAQLQALTDLHTAVTAETTSLATAVAANP